MSELSDWKLCVLPDELAAARAQGKAEGIAEVIPTLEAARSLIAELQKRIGEQDEELRQTGRAEACHLEEIAELRDRIGELEAERDEARNRNARVELEAVGYSNRMHEAIARAEAAEQALTAERQRRDEAEAVAKALASRFRDSELPEYRRWTDYIARHPSSSGNEPGNGRSE